MRCLTAAIWCQATSGCLVFQLRRELANGLSDHRQVMQYGGLPDLIRQKLDLSRLGNNDGYFPRGGEDVLQIRRLTPAKTTRASLRIGWRSHGFSPRLLTRSTLRPSSASSSSASDTKLTSPIRVVGWNSTRRSMSLPGRTSPRAAEPKTESRLTPYRRQMVPMRSAGSSIPDNNVTATLRYHLSRARRLLGLRRQFRRRHRQAHGVAQRFNSGSTAVRSCESWRGSSPAASAPCRTENRAPACAGRWTDPCGR